MPVTISLIRALLSFYLYYGDNFKIERPTGTGNSGGTQRSRPIPHWKDYLLFYEYFHGDNGAGLGPSHRTGWTGLVGNLVEFFGRVEAAVSPRRQSNCPCSKRRQGVIDDVTVPLETRRAKLLQRAARNSDPKITPELNVIRIQVL
jgi:hypothetical protein